VIVSTVATNLKDCAPFASLHRKTMSPADLRAWSTFVEEGELDEANSPGQALKRYQEADAIDDEYAQLEFRIARVAMKLGDYKAAKESFHSSPGSGHSAVSC
jgi:tetratricopeptide (TPR) repeat protein